MDLDQQLENWHRGKSTPAEIWYLCEFLKAGSRQVCLNLAGQFFDEEQINQGGAIWSDPADKAHWSTWEELEMEINPESNVFVSSTNSLHVKHRKRPQGSYERIKFQSKLAGRDITERLTIKWPGELFVVGDVKKPLALFQRLHQSKSRPWPWLRERLSTELQSDLTEYTAKQYASRDMQERFIDWLNLILIMERLDQERAFAPHEKNNQFAAGKKKVKPRLKLPTNPLPGEIVDSNRRIIGELLGDYLSNVEYLGEGGFKCLYTHIWLQRFLDAVGQQEGRHEEEDDDVDLKQKVPDLASEKKDQITIPRTRRKKSGINQPKPLATNRDSDTPQDKQYVYEEDWDALKTNPSAPIKLDERDTVFEMVQGLGFLQFHLEEEMGRSALAEIAQAQVLFLKSCVNPCPSLRYLRNGPGPDGATAATNRRSRLVFNGLSTKTIESLWDVYSPEEIELSEDALWNFSKIHLELTLDKFFKRKHQYLQAILESPAIQELKFWKNGAGRRWLRNMANWIEDLSKVSNKTPQDTNKDDHQLCDVLESYLRTMIAEAHPSHGGKNLEQIRTMPVKDLIKINNPSLIIPRELTLEEFGASKRMRELYGNISLSTLEKKLHHLEETLKSLKPKPQRLFGLLEILKSNPTRKTITER